MADDNVDRVWELMKKLGFCMLSTLDGDDIRARPMAASVERDENAVYFLTDKDSAKDDEIKARPNVGLAFADASAQKYVSVSGTAEVSNDRAKIKELFTPATKAWWDSPEDPDIRVLKITPHSAEYWDSPGTIVSYVKILAAAAFDKQKPAVGDNAKVSL